MKKQLFSLLALLVISVGVAQTIPNGGFENWSTFISESPQYFQSSNTGGSGNNSHPANVTKTTDAKHGNYAVKMNTIAYGGDTIGAFVANGNPGQTVTGGVPYSQKPTGMRFYYKSTIMPGDSALTLAIFKKSGAVIGQYIYKIGTSQSVYTLFSQTFSPALPQTPDTVVFACAAGNLMVNNGVPGTMLQVDSVSFTGVASQPINFNGDFEVWQNDTLYGLQGWNSNGFPLESNDKYSGNHAVELITYPPGFGSSQPQSSSVLTGHNNNHTGPTGGTPYSTQIDTLVFHYKYIPANYPGYTDSARVFVTFFKNGIQLMNNVYQLLGPAVSNYTQVSLPFNLPTAPDTVLISFESSNYPIQDSYIGSDLKVDELYFKSQKLTVSSFVLPTTGCKGVPIQLVDNSTNMASQWTWYMTGASPSTSSAQNPTIVFNPSSVPHTYTVTLYATGPFGSIAPGYISKTITIYDNPIVMATSAIICSGKTTTLTASGASTYTWNNQATATGSTYSVTPSGTTNYTVVGTSTVGCSGSAVSSVVVLTAPTPTICMVTADDSSVYNIIFYDKTVYLNVDSFIAYREVSSNVYKRIGSQHYSAFSQFIDTARHVGGPNGGNPNTGTYRYKLQTVDTCGNYSALSPYHNTVYITTSGNGHFSWATPYQVEGQASPDTNYVLACDTANTNVWTPVATIAGTQQTVSDPGFIHHANIANWRVDALGFNCTPTLRLGNGTNSTMAARVKSHSNQSNNRASGIKQSSVNSNQVVVYPNPSMGTITISNSQKIDELKVTDILGNVVYDTKSADQKVTLHLENSGVYFITVVSGKETSVKKVIVNN